MDKEQQLTISVIIPTLNRANDMARLLPTIISQTSLPDELIIVDQSKNNATKDISYKLLANIAIKLNYIHDSSFNGLVKAKEIGSKQANGDIICFLDDDIVLDNDYFNNIKLGFKQNINMLGCMGYITSENKQSKLYLYAHDIFFKGIFTDNRPKILANINDNSAMLIKSNLLSGGASSWQKEIFENIEFDTNNNFHNFEDTDYSTRAVKLYGNSFYINTKAKMQHITTQPERTNYYIMQKGKIINAFMFYKKNSHQKGASIDLTLILIWWFIESVLLSIKNLSLAIFFGYIIGIFSGIRKKVL